MSEEKKMCTGSSHVQVIPWKKKYCNDFHNNKYIQSQDSQGTRDRGRSGGTDLPGLGEEHRPAWVRGRSTDLPGLAGKSTDLPGLGVGAQTCLG